jgi:hypothetical protein
MIRKYSVTVTIAWSLSKGTWTWYITFTYIKPISVDLPVWYIFLAAAETVEAVAGVVDVDAAAILPNGRLDILGLCVIR